MCQHKFFCIKQIYIFIFKLDAIVRDESAVPVGFCCCAIRLLIFLVAQALLAGSSAALAGRLLIFVLSIHSVQTLRYGPLSKESYSSVWRETECRLYEWLLARCSVGNKRYELEEWNMGWKTSVITKNTFINVTKTSFALLHYHCITKEFWPIHNLCCLFRICVVLL